MFVFRLSLQTIGFAVVGNEVWVTLPKLRIGHSHRKVGWESVLKHITVCRVRFFGVSPQNFTATFGGFTMPSSSLGIKVLNGSE